MTANTIAAGRGDTRAEVERVGSAAHFRHDADRGLVRSGPTSPSDRCTRWAHGSPHRRLTPRSWWPPTCASHACGSPAWCCCSREQEGAGGSTCAAPRAFGLPARTCCVTDLRRSLRHLLACGAGADAWRELAACGRSTGRIRPRNVQSLRRTRDEPTTATGFCICAVSSGSGWPAAARWPTPRA